MIERETLLFLREELEQNYLDKLEIMLDKKASNFPSFSEELTEQIGSELYQKKGQIICRLAQVGRRRFLDKLGWLLNYEQELQITSEILEVFALAKNLIIQQGLHQNSPSDWLNLIAKFSSKPWIKKPQQKVTEYLALEAQKIPLNQTFPATSDLIESLFGKYKIFSSFSPCSEINEMILTLILSTLSLTPEQVLQAMETIHITDVNAWSKQVFGQSILSKRKVAFNTPENYTKVA